MLREKQSLGLGRSGPSSRETLTREQRPEQGGTVPELPVGNVPGRAANQCRDPRWSRAGEEEEDEEEEKRAEGNWAGCRGGTWGGRAASHSESPGHEAYLKAPSTHSFFFLRPGYQVYFYYLSIADHLHILASLLS